MSFIMLQMDLYLDVIKEWWKLEKIRNQVCISHTHKIMELEESS